MKENRKEGIRKIGKNGLIFLFLLILIAPIILTKEIGDLDELWNYNFARNVFDGLIPYRDFNMVQTPMLPSIASIGLKIFRK